MASFADRVAALRPDVVVDLVCFTLESATALVDRLRGEVVHLVHLRVDLAVRPEPEVADLEDSAASASAPFDEYGIQKDRIGRMLKEETAAGGMATTSLDQRHIVGPGWHPIGPMENFDPQVWHTLSAGEPQIESRTPRGVRSPVLPGVKPRSRRPT